MTELEEIVNSAPEDPEMVHCMALLLLAVAKDFDLCHMPEIHIAPHLAVGWNRLSLPLGGKSWEWDGSVTNIGSKGFCAIREDVGI